MGRNGWTEFWRHTNIQMNHLLGWASGVLWLVLSFYMYHSLAQERVEMAETRNGLCPHICNS